MGMVIIDVYLFRCKLHYCHEMRLSIVGDLIESNLRQRVLGNTNPVKLGRCFIFLNKYYGFERGGNGSNQYGQKAKLLTIADHNIPSNQIELANSYKITRQTMSNYMRMASMIPELEGLVDTGIKTAPLVIIRRAIFYSISKCSSNVILKLGNMTICKSSLFCSVTVL